MSPTREGRAIARLLACSVALLFSLFVAAGNAAQERYDYDALGRLVRVIDEQGRVTEYVYDAAGNILQVITGATAQAPAVASISPTSIRRGESRPVTIAGSNLTGATVGVTDPGLDLSSVQVTANQISFTLAAALTAALGAQQINIRNAAGTASASISVNPALPKLSMTPQPIAVAANSPARSFSVTLSNADTVDHVVSVTSANPAIAIVSPPSITFSAGQIEAVVSITGQSVGSTVINLNSSTLTAIVVPVGVGPTPLGDAVSVTRSLSVHMPGVIPGAPSGNAMSVTAQPVSVHMPGVIPGAPSGNAMSVTAQPVSVHMPGVIPGAPPGDAVSVTQPVSVHVPGVISGAPTGNAMSVTQPVSVAVP